MKRLFFYAFLIVGFIFNSCRKPDNKQMKEGYTPIYLSKHDAYDISFKAPQPVENPGKIYIKDSSIYLVEKDEGIHVINNSNPQSPEITGFLKIPGIKNISIKTHVLYAENFTDIVAVDISDIKSPRIAKRIKDVNPVKNIMAPEEDGWFECADTTKGYVIGWRKQTINNPKCYKGIDPEYE